MPAAVSREEVLEAARQALSDGREPTMEDFARAAGISPRTLFRLFGSREALLRELDREPAPSARERVLDAALELVGRRGLADLSMDDLAAVAGVSRATVYRLFPGKPALFRELIRRYSPWEPVADVLEDAAGRPPDRVMPEVARAVARALSGRTWLLLRIVSDMVRGDPDAAEGVSRSMSRGLPDLVGYLTGQMAAGRLRRMHPVLALQLLAGPIVVHMLTQPLAARTGAALPTDEAVDQIVDSWLRAMAPAPDAGQARPPVIGHPA